MSEQYQPEKGSAENYPSGQRPEPAQPESSEREHESRRSVFDLEHMPTEHVLLLHEALSVADSKATDGENVVPPSRFEPLLDAFEEGFVELPTRNIDKAREVVDALAHSDAYRNRVAAAIALRPLLRREHELGSDRISDEVALWINLHRDDERDAGGAVSGAAYASMTDALQEGWLRPDMAKLIDDELGPD